MGERGQSLNLTPQALRDYHIAESAKVEAREPSRLSRKRAEQYVEATGELHKALEVCQFFGLPFLAISRKIDKREANNAQAADLIKEAAKRELAERTERNIAYAEKYLTDPDVLPIWNVETHRGVELLPPDLREKFFARVREVNAGAFDKWRNGADTRLPYECPVMLRSESPDMVTSKGARVPLADAERTFRFVIALRAKGWHRNGETHAVGGYQLDAVNEFGVVAGCHRVSWEEITRFAKSQNWTS
jgi:hypothetical protein